MLNILCPNVIQSSYTCFRDRLVVRVIHMAFTEMLYYLDILLMTELCCVRSSMRSTFLQLHRGSTPTDLRNALEGEWVYSRTLIFRSAIHLHTR
jgi:hypothetical protein